MTAPTTPQAQDAPPRPGRPREFSEDAALNAAMQVFWRKGFEASSLDDLTAAMGISRSSFYGCFGSKHGALVAAIRAYARDRRAAFAALTAAQPDPQAAAAAAVDALVSAGGGRHGCFLVNCVAELSPHDPEMARIAKDHLERLEALAAETLAAADPTRAAARARTLVALSIGAATLAKAGIAPAALKAIGAEARRLLAP